jgi:hypothetical protein
VSTRPIAGVVAALAFACEVAMLVLLVVAGIGLASSTPARIVLAVALPVAAAAIWGSLMAPKARHRLADPARLVAQAVLFVATGVLLAAAGHPVLGVVFAVVAVAVFVWGRRVDAPAVASTRT